MGLPPVVRPAFDFGGAWFALLVRQELHYDETRRTETKERHAACVTSGRCRRLRPRPSGARGITEMRGPAPRPDGAVQVFLSDPDGYLLEIVSKPPVITGSAP